MNELVPVLVFSIIGAVATSACCRGFSRFENRIVALSFFVHLAFALAQIPIVRAFYSGSDMLMYFHYGDVLSRMMEADSRRVAPEVFSLLLHREHRLPIMIIGDGNATGSMSAIAAFIFYAFGPAKYGACALVAMFSLCGKIAIYRVFRNNTDRSTHAALAVAALLVPSFVFWSAGLIKEGVAIGGLGWVLFGLDQWVRAKRPDRALPIMVLGAVPVAVIKPYILFGVVVAGGCWYYWTRSSSRGRFRIRPAYIVMATALAIGGVVALGNYFPEYAFESIGSHTSQLQKIGQTMRGGSNYTIASDAPTTLLGQLAYTPAALATALFRPSIFEARNLLMLANALETTVLTVMFLRVAFGRTMGAIRRDLVAQPVLIFCLVFVIAFGVAVGLASSNLGTLSRYRSPLVPFFVALLIVLGSPMPRPSLASVLPPRRRALS